MIGLPSYFFIILTSLYQSPMKSLLVAAYYQLHSAHSYEQPTIKKSTSFHTQKGKLLTDYQLDRHTVKSESEIWTYDPHMKSELYSFSFMALTLWTVDSGKTAPSGAFNNGTAAFCFSRVDSILPCTFWMSFTSSRRVTNFICTASPRLLALLSVVEAQLALLTHEEALGLVTLEVALESLTLKGVLVPLTLGKHCGWSLLNSHLAYRLLFLQIQVPFYMVQLMKMK